MRTYKVQARELLPTIVQKTMPYSGYTSVVQYRLAIIQINAVDNGTVPVIWNWTTLKAGTLVRLPG
jgi:hypothetical protein